VKGPASSRAGGRGAGTRTGAGRPRPPVQRPMSTPASGVRTASRGAAGRPGTGSPDRVRVVSATSADRFAARVRRRRLRRAALAGGALVLGLAVGWLLFGSTFLAVRHVVVRGVDRVPVDAVRAAVRPEVGRPMAIVSTQGAAARVAAVPLVKSVQVVRSWPSTLIVQVNERQPLAAVPAASGRVDLVDGDGVVVVAAAAAAPPGLPLLDVDVRRAGPAGLRAARSVSDGLPDRVRLMVRRISATSADGVTLVLTDGTTVLWGSAEENDVKADALLALHPKPLRKATTVDVSSPDTPAITVPR
jgi:cell division protein FtsQ